MILKRGARGEEVRHVQELLLALGYPLPRFGADGALGLETIGAVNAALARYSGRGISPDQEVTPQEVETLERLVGAQSLPQPERPDHDLTRESDPRAVVRLRAMSGVTRLCLHQTATVLGESPARWLSVPVHAGVTRAGRVVYLHPPEAYLYAANGLNRSSVSIEIDGHFCGVAGDLRTYWRPQGSQREPLTLTPPQIEGGRRAIRWLCAEVRRAGGEVREVVAHRQSSADRESDPGSEVWQALGVWSREVLGLATPLDLVLEDGAPIPCPWDPASPHPYRRRP